MNHFYNLNIFMDKYNLDQFYKTNILILTP